jgi:hypothetical protein
MREILALSSKKSLISSVSSQQIAGKKDENEVL